MRRSLVKAFAAEEDLIGIWVYTYRRWGEAQADKYLYQIELGLNQICVTPQVGKISFDLRFG